ncbi:autotransporter domain-containing protein [Camelimonas fluminis]|uniref:Autotransporter domain-containing protein n=1 Tax=Camelimonas fluminis TaxID=1576911 RepID=A0ABV7ULE6_9HYPH|nr:autotransporter domain-containing protein [Camelimonas fluminis]
MPVATANGVNYPDAIGSSPYGPSFGNQGGVLRTVGSYMTAASSPYDLSYLYDGATAPNQQITPLAYPSAPGNPTLYTIAHSTFGDTVVGNYDTRLATGNAMIYTISTGSYATNNKPGAISTTAYGVYGDMIAGGYAEVGPGGGIGFEHGYLYNKITGTWTTYDHPAAIITHLEGITGAGRSGEYNMVADWVTPDGVVHAGVLHVDALGIPTWHEINIPGATLVSSNSAYGDTVVGIYLLPGSTTPNGFVATIPGIYNPIRNVGALTSSADNAAALSGRKGDDIVNSGSVRVSGNGGIGIRGETYGVLTNSGTVVATGPLGAAVEMHGLYGTLLNYGVLQAPAVADALRTGPDSFGTVIVNTGVIDGRIAATAGPQKRFENSGWIGVTGTGVPITHLIGGVFAQTQVGTLSLRVGADGNDALGVKGVARLAGTLAVPFQTSLLLNSYTLVGATDGMTGSFTTLATSGLPDYVSAALAYTGTSVVLNLTSQMAQQPGLSANQSAVSGAVDGFFNGNAQTNTGNTASAALGHLYGLGQPQLGAALGMLSGEIHAALPSGLNRESGLVRETILDRLRGRVASAPFAADPKLPRSIDPAAVGVWGEAIGAWERAGSDRNASTVQRQTGGFIFGADVLAPAATLPEGIRLGIAGGYLTTNVDVDRLLSHGTTSSAFGALYAGTSIGPWRLAAGGVYMGSRVETNRAIQFGPFSDFANAKQDAASLQAFGEAGYSLLAGQGAVGGLSYTATVEPFVNAAAIRLRVDGFSERGGDSALAGFSRDYDLGVTTIGARLEARFEAPALPGANTVTGGQFVLRASLGWRAAFGDVDPAALLAFRSSLNSGDSLSAFEISSVPVDRSAVVVGVGLDWQVSSAVTLGASYGAQAGSNATDQTLKGRFNVRF